MKFERGIESSARILPLHCGLTRMLPVAWRDASDIKRYLTLNVIYLIYATAPAVAGIGVAHGSSPCN